MEFANFNVDDVGQRNGNFGGMPFTAENAGTVLIPVPWDVTVSYRDGTAKGPAAILEASPQLDFFDERVPEAWKQGIFMDEIPAEMLEKNTVLREKAVRYIDWLETGSDATQAEAMEAIRLEINQACEEMNAHVQQKAKYFLDRDKIVGIIGGDHSTPLGLIRELGERYPNFGILHLDAHRDLRDAYEGFTYSHASIMHNALKVPAVSHLAQVGVRDFCETEHAMAKESYGRVSTFTGRKIHRMAMMGVNFSTQVERILSRLPGDIYVSFDIDALEPWLCPNTGTPVPGGLGYEQSLYILECLVERGARIIGFDITEVSPAKNGEDSPDAMIGARLAFRIATLAAVSWGRTRMREI